MGLIVIAYIVMGCFLEGIGMVLITVPVFLLIIAHLFMLTGLSSTAKTVWIAAGWLSAFVHLLAPWLIRYGGTAWPTQYAGHILESL